MYLTGNSLFIAVSSSDSTSQLFMTLPTGFDKQHTAFQSQCNGTIRQMIITLKDKVKNKKCHN
jgi:hypothetical protein